MLPKIEPMTASSSSTLANPVPLRQDARTIGLIGLAHGSSHFFHMLLPPLFPWLIGEFGFSYSELGLLVSVFGRVGRTGRHLSGSRGALQSSGHLHAHFLIATWAYGSSAQGQYEANMGLQSLQIRMAHAWCMPDALVRCGAVMQRPAHRLHVPHGTTRD